VAGGLLEQRDDLPGDIGEVGCDCDASLLGGKPAADQCSGQKGRENEYVVFPHGDIPPGREEINELRLYCCVSAMRLFCLALYE